MDTPNRTVNVSSGGPRGFGRQRGRRGYYGGYGDSRQNFNNGIPGYNSSQPEKAPPGY